MAAIVLMASLGGPALARREPYSVWDEGPLGLGHLVREEQRGLRTFAGHPLVLSEGRLTPRQGWALIVVEPQRGFDAGEAARLQGYLEAGGIALLAGSSPALAELLTRLPGGLALGGPLYSPGFQGNAQFPVASGLGGDWVLTQPRAVTGGLPLLRTGLAWEDANGDGRPQLGESVAAFAVGASATVGRGELIVLGSGSPLTRDGWARGPGAAVLARLGAPDAGIVLDESHRLALDPLGIGGLLTGEAGGWAVPAVLMVGVAAWALRPEVRRKDEGLPPPPGARMVVEAAEEVRP